MHLNRSALAVAALLALSPGGAASQDAQQRYEEACDDGTLASCTILGMMYERGAGVERDAARAASLYRTACDGGALAACINLARLHESGAGVERSPVRAARLYRRACDGGEALACDLLATLERNASLASGGFFKAGRIEDEATGNPLPEAVAEVPSLGIRAISDASGRVELGRIPPGRYGIVVERFGYESVDGEIEVPGDGEFVVLMPRASVSDPFATARIVGRVYAEDASQGLPGVEIAIGESSRTLSNAEGAFLLEDLAAGLHQVTFTHLGYARRSTPVVLQAGATVELSARMSAKAIELDPIDVTVRSRFLERSGFYRRARAGWGTHFTPELIERIDPRTHRSTLRLRPAAGPRARRARAVRSRCHVRHESASGEHVAGPLSSAGLRGRNAQLRQRPGPHAPGVDRSHGGLSGRRHAHRVRGLRRGAHLDAQVSVVGSRVRFAALLLMLLVGALPASAAAQGTDRLYQDACDRGDVLACNLFGMMLETGRGVARDLTRAGELYRAACERGASAGCTNLGRLYQAGVGLPSDSARASGLFQIACEGGDGLGCQLLALQRTSAAPDPVERYVKSGRVRDAETGTALADAIVEVPELGVRAVSDATGSFSVLGLPGGRYRLSAERAGYDVLEGELEVPGRPQFVVLLTPSEGIDARASGQIVGLVTEEGDVGLGNVDVVVVGRESARTLTNQQGRFAIRDVPPGLVSLRFARIGYVPRTATVIVQPEATVEVGATLPVEPIQFEAIEVSVRSRNLEQSGFYERAEAGPGTHFRPSDLAELQPVVLSDALRARVPGVRVEQDIVGGRARLVSRRSFSVSQGECPLMVVVDGLKLDPWDLDLFPPEAIEAIEVYQGIEAPVQYQYEGDACGVVLIWTRRAN